MKCRTSNRHLIEATYPTPYPKLSGESPNEGLSTDLVRRRSVALVARIFGAIPTGQPSVGPDGTDGERLIIHHANGVPTTTAIG